MSSLVARSSTSASSAGPPSDGDQRLDALVALGGNASGLKERQQRPEDVGSADRLKGKQQTLRRTLKVEPAGPHLGQPDGLELSRRQPEGVIEKRIDRPIEGAHRQAQPTCKVGNARQHAHGFEPDARVFILHSRGQERQGLGQAAMPELDHASRRRANARIA